MKQKNLIGIIFIIGGFGIIFSTYSVTDDNVTNQEALIIEAFFASVFGLYILRLQRLDNDKMQVILEKQNTLAEEIHRHISQQQQIQDSIRATSFRYVKSNLETARDRTYRMREYIQSYEAPDTRVRAKHLDNQLMINRTIRYQTNAIDQQLTIVRPYIHAALAQKIEEASVRIQQTWLSSADKRDSRIFVVEIPDSVNDWLKYAKSTTDFIDSLIKELPKK